MLTYKPLWCIKTLWVVKLKTCVKAQPWIIQYFMVTSHLQTCYERLFYQMLLIHYLWRTFVNFVLIWIDLVFLPYHCLNHLDVFAHDSSNIIHTYIYFLNLNTWKICFKNMFFLYCYIFFTTFRPYSNNFVFSLIWGFIIDNVCVNVSITGLTHLRPERKSHTDIFVQTACWKI